MRTRAQTRATARLYRHRCSRSSLAHVGATHLRRDQGCRAHLCELALRLQSQRDCDDTHARDRVWRMLARSLRGRVQVAERICADLSPDCSHSTIIAKPMLSFESRARALASVLARPRDVQHSTFRTPDFSDFPELFQTQIMPPRDDSIYQRIFSVWRALDQDILTLRHPRPPA